MIVVVGGIKGGSGKTTAYHRPGRCVSGPRRAERPGPVHATASAVRSSSAERRQVEHCLQGLPAQRRREARLADRDLVCTSAPHVADAYPEETPRMPCTMVGCPGTYEPRETVVVERAQGQLMVIEHVPVEVCAVCGDVLLRPETVRHLEALRHTAASPQRTVPLYKYV